jgi:hypothetical protein
MSDVDADRGKGDGGQEISGKFVVACGDPAQMLEFVEEALDQVALAIAFEVDGAYHPDVALAGDVGGGSARGEEFDDAAGAVAAVSAIASRAGRNPAMRLGKVVLSEAWPGVSSKRTGRPTASTTAWILVLNPPRERPMA